MNIDQTGEAWTRIENLARRTGIRLMLQFGSTVAGTCHPHSDVDIAVMFETGEASLRLLIEISEELRGLFPGKEIDLAVLNRADPLLLKKITENCRFLFGKPEDLAQLRLYTFKRYQDYPRFLALERQFVGDRLAALCAGQQSQT